MTIEVLPRILLVSTKADIATDYVVLKLSDLGASFYRLNTEDLPLISSSTIRVASSLWPTSWNWLSPAQQNICLDKVRSVWFRRHRLPIIPEEIAEAHAEYCLRESDWFIRGGLFSLGISDRQVSWMSHPLKVRQADAKIYQLSMARALGFDIPDTLISNDADDVRAFFQQKNGNIVAKPLRLGYFDYGERQTSVYTNKVVWADLQDANAIKIAPVIYQELLLKLYDIRVTVVGQKLFAAAIDSQSIPSASLDWRRTDTDKLGHFKHDLPRELAQLCVRYVAALGLSYGALDFVLTPDNKYIFLEINPNGQWVWLEEQLGFPISEEIATWLFTRSQKAEGISIPVS